MAARALWSKESAMLVTATDLAGWAAQRDAQALLPKLLRRLVHATAKTVLRSSFPAGEGVQSGGWDGVVSVEQGNAFVPEGSSGWEMSAQENSKGKAEEDYKKRCQDSLGIIPSQSTFVFVTLRRWNGKEAWARARRGEGVWRDVRAYDADNLEEWLELAPVVHIWLSIFLGRRPEDTTDLGKFWDDWSATTRPITTPEFVLSGRQVEVERIHGWLRDPSTVQLTLQAESRDEALAVFAASIQQFPSDERIACLSRAVVVDGVSGWNRLAPAGEPLVLVPTFDSPEAITRAVRLGHKVVVPLGRADPASDQTVKIPRLSRSEAEKILIACGIAANRARSLAVLARRSLKLYRRELALIPELHKPEWAHPAGADSLPPVMLAGSWNDAQEGDRKAIAVLTQKPYEDADQVFVRWANGSDPPVRRVGHAWYVVSKEDMWTLLAHYLKQDDLERFKQVVLDILGTPDPRFDLPNDQRWAASVFGHGPRHSDLLREGLADTLAAMGARGDTSALSLEVSGYAKHIVRQLLELANADWKVWASLSRVLPFLAEAAPDVFLDAIDKGLAGEQPLLLNLFINPKDVLFSSSPHTGLLWALETLAWSSAHLGRVALLLARVTKLDPEGKLINPPQGSLRSVFLPWFPQTAASLEQRFNVLDMLREREPGVAWRLMQQLLPKGQGIEFNNPTPRWREWAPDSPRHATGAEYATAIHGIVGRMLADVGESGSRWEDLIESLATLPLDDHSAVAERLSGLNVEHLRSSDRAAIWNALRKLISRHKSFPDAGWALGRDPLDRLDEVLRRFEPRESVDRYGWLFADMPDLSEGRKGDDWKTHQEVVVNAQRDAIRIIHIQSGLAGVLELVKCVERPDTLGRTLGESGLADSEEDNLLGGYLAADDATRAQFARGFVAGRVWSCGREWAQRKLAGVAKEWIPAQVAELLVCMPMDGRTWDLVQAMGQEVEQRYWGSVGPYGIRNDVERAARKFLEYDYPHTLIELLSLHVGKKQILPAELIADALERLLKAPLKNNRSFDNFSYHLSELLEVLAASKEIKESRVAMLEWAFLPLLGRYERTPKLLHRELARDPDFFAQIVSLVFRAEGEASRDASEEEQARANRGYDLLESWVTVPGTMDDGNIDPNTLKDWVRRARKALATSGRLSIGDDRIGRVLSTSLASSDGTWPHQAVRDVIEQIASAELEEGFGIGVYNKRGVVMKDPREGGAQERQLAGKFESFAAAVSDKWPRTAALLRQIEARYRAEAKQEDQEVELREDLAI